MITFLHHIISYIMASVSVVLSFGVTVHDTQAGHVLSLRAPHRAASVYADLQVAPAKPISDLHTPHAHADYNPLSQTLTNTFSYQSPSIAPRRDTHHKQILRVIQMGGRHAFDNTNLPILT